eukprot:5274117-Amphidinium_carterae.1
MSVGASFLTYRGNVVLHNILAKSSSRSDCDPSQERGPGAKAPIQRDSYFRRDNLHCSANREKTLLDASLCSLCSDKLRLALQGTRGSSKRVDELMNSLAESADHKLYLQQRPVPGKNRNLGLCMRQRRIR